MFSLFCLGEPRSIEVEIRAYNIGKEFREQIILRRSATTLFEEAAVLLFFFFLEDGESALTLSYVQEHCALRRYVFLQFFFAHSYFENFVLGQEKCREHQHTIVYGHEDRKVRLGLQADVEGSS